jgi:hypothetical protein
MLCRKEIAFSPVPQGSDLEPLLFNDLRDAINYSRYVLFEKYIKIYCAINFYKDCNLRPSDIGFVRCLVRC